MCNYTNMLLIGLIWIHKWIGFIRPRAFLKLLWKLNGCVGRLVQTMTVIAAPTRNLDHRALFTPFQIAHIGK